MLFFLFLKIRKSLDGQTDIYRGLVTTPNDGSALVFVSSRLLSHIRRSKTLFSDATFLVVPIGFYQLFTVHIALNNHIFPVVSHDNKKAGPLPSGI